MLLADFQTIRPPFTSKQEETLDWLVAAHVQAESVKTGQPIQEMNEFRDSFRERLWHVGCKPDRIAERGHIVSDVHHRDWEKMEIYQIDKSHQGAPLEVRLKHYEEHADRAFETFYPESEEAPDGIIHVTCTGYASPSAAQKIVSKRGWNTEVTHAYHMGCYGAFPALRIGRGFLATGQERIDLVHTEFCSLHSNPSLHRLDQLVCQSLFADGMVKYSVIKGDEGGRGLRLLALSEEIIPASSKAMTWNIASWGFEMTLAKEVPVLIARSLIGYLKRLCSKGGLSWEKILPVALFAIHPGGPKILLQIQELLGLSDEQLSFSFEILRKYGNMSSATIPHVWDSILADCPTGIVVSLAFGPGLTISGSVMEICG